MGTDELLAEADAEEDGLTYVPFKGWLEARPGRYVHLGAAVLLVLQALVRAYVKLGGWFVADDMSFIGRAEHLPFLSRAYLLEGWNGHLMPGSFALVRLLNHLWPVDYVPVAVVDLALQALAGVLVYRLLVGLFGSRPAVLVPLAVFLFSPITLPAFLWWAAALNQVPGQVAMAAALLMQVRYHRLGRTRDGVLGAVCVAAGLLFSEKLLLVVPCVAGMTLLLFTPGRPMSRLRRAATEHWRVWLAYLLVVVPYCSYYLTHVPSPVRSPDSTVAVQTVGTALTKAVLPALFGGPLRWSQIGVGAVADPAPAFLVLTSVGAALVVWTSLVLHRRAVFGWVLVGGYWLANAVLLGVTRASYVGPVIGAEYRYSTDVCLVVAVFGTASFLPLAGTFRRGAPQRLVRRRLLQLRTAPGPGTGTGTGTEPTVAGALCCALVVTSLVSTFQYDHFWRQNDSSAYFAHARGDIERSGRQLTLADTTLPARVQQGFLGSFIRTSTMMSGFRPRPRFLTPGSASDALYLPDDSGHLRAASVDGFRNRPGPSGGCGWRVASEPVSIPLQRTTLAWQWTVRIGYLASEAARATVTAGTVTSAVTIQPGVHSLFVLGEGPIGSVELGGLSAGALCTDDVTVGTARAMPDTRP